MHTYTYSSVKTTKFCLTFLHADHNHCSSDNSRCEFALGSIHTHQKCFNVCKNICFLTQSYSGTERNKKRKGISLKDKVKVYIQTDSTHSWHMLLTSYTTSCTTSARLCIPFSFTIFSLILIFFTLCIILKTLTL